MASTANMATALLTLSAMAALFVGSRGWVVMRLGSLGGLANQEHMLLLVEHLGDGDHVGVLMASDDICWCA